MKLVQAAQMFQQSFQGFGDGRKFQVAMNNDVEYREEPKTHVAEIHGETLISTGAWLI